jgi:hypothetical protein
LEAAERRDVPSFLCKSQPDTKFEKKFADDHAMQLTAKEYKRLLKKIMACRLQIKIKIIFIASARQLL